MSEPSPQQPDQSLNISGSILENVQIGGIAGRDLNLNQIQGGVGTLNVFGTVQVPQAPLSAAKPISQEEHRRRTVLLNRVRQDWVEGVLKRSLHTKVLIELGLQERKELVQNPLSGVEEFPSESRKVFPDGTAATDIFEGIGAGRTLLILGEPGAGKTVTLLKLAESLIARTENDLSQPLPVVINLSSWAQQRKSIPNWLVQELSEKYHVPKLLGKAWVGQEQLILLLDGLDEVDAKYRNDCIKALNQFVQDHGLTELVVCSRIQDYEHLSDRLKLRSAIYIQPLTSHQIDQFLELAGDSLSTLKTVLQNNADLRAFASSPLILSIMSLTYQGCSAEVLIQAKTLEEQQKQLFDTYIDRMFTRRGTTRQYFREKTLHWLNWLAQRMVQSSQTIFLIEQLQPSWLSSRKQTVLHWFLNALFFGIISSIVVALISLIHILTVGIIGKLITISAFHESIETLIQMFYGLVFGLVFGLIFGRKNQIEPVEKLKWSWRKAKKSFYNGFLFSFFISLILVVFTGLNSLNSGFLVWLLTFLTALLFFWLFFGLFLGSIFGLIGGFRDLEIQKSYIPNQGIWQSIKNASVTGLAITTIFGLTFVPIFSLISNLLIGLSDGLSMGVLLGVICGLAYGGWACLQHFTLRLILHRQNSIPWNYADFLDYAADRLFMQKVGGGYIFVHRMLLEHFAQMKS